MKTRAAGAGRDGLVLRVSRGNLGPCELAAHSTSSFFDNAVIADVETVLAAFPQSMYSTVNVVLDSAAGFDTLKKAWPPTRRSWRP